MEKNEVHFRHLLIWKEKQLYSKKICAVYGDGTIAESTVNKWFARLGIGNFDLEDREPSKRLAVVDDN